MPLFVVDNLTYSPACGPPCKVYEGNDVESATVSCTQFELESVETFRRDPEPREGMVSNSFGSTSPAGGELALATHTLQPVVFWNLPAEHWTQVEAFVSLLHVPSAQPARQLY